MEVLETNIAEISVSYSHISENKVKISNANSAHSALRKMWDVELLTIQEQFCVLYLNNANEIVGFRCISTGSITACTVDLKLIFGIACKSLSSAIVIAHNHPSGSTEISEADHELTQKIRRIGAMMGVKLLDHIILTDKNYVSFSERGYL